MFHVEQNNYTTNFSKIFLQASQKFGFSFSEEVLQKFSQYYDQLCKWDRSINLTGLRTDKDRAVLLFVDSLAGYWALSEKFDKLIVDIGTGGGFPGIPLKLTLPAMQVFLMEPRANKIAFLHNIIGKLHLTGISVIPNRLQDFHSMVSEEEKCDVALCKGVNVEHLLPFLNQILKKTGKLVVFGSKNIDNPHLIGMKVHEEIIYELPFGYGNRVLSILQQEF